VLHRHLGAQGRALALRRRACHAAMIFILF
jgi:hypothetical protein